MTSKERVRIALSHEEPDRVPMYCDFTPEIADLLNRHVRAQRGTETLCEGAGSTELGVALGNDMVVTVHGVVKGFYASGDDEYLDEWGIRWRNVPYRGGSYTEMASHPLADESRIADYRLPDPLLPSRYDEVRDVLKRYGDSHWIVSSPDGTVFETSWFLRGMDNLLLDMVQRKDLAHHLMDKVSAYSLATAKRLVELGVDMIWVGDDVGTQHGMMFSPALWREFIKPRYSVIFSEIKRMNPLVKIAYHSDGNCEEVVPDLIEIGLDVLNPVQPECMDPAEMKRKYGKNLSFFGTVSVQRTMPYGSADDVAAEVRHRIRTVGREGGLIIAPSHNVQPDTNLENALAFFDAVRRFGCYPLPS